MLKKLIIPVGIGLGMGAAYTPRGERLSDAVTSFAVAYHVLPARPAPQEKLVLTAARPREDRPIDPQRIGEGSNLERAYVEWIQNIRIDQPTVVVYQNIELRGTKEGPLAAPIIVTISSGKTASASVADAGPADKPATSAKASTASPESNGARDDAALPKVAAATMTKPISVLEPCGLCTLANPLGEAGGDCPI